MEGLRLILLAVGAVVIVGVYLYSRRGSHPRPERADGESAPSRRAPTLRAAPIDDDVPDDLPRLSAVDDAAANVDVTADVADDDDVKEAPRAERQEKIIVLNIFPLEDDAKFPGADLLDVFDRAGLEYGQYDVFHRIRETADGPRSVFSVASATEPGSFDITGMAEESFRGLTLFMLLPGPVRGVDAFADMLATARRIAEQIRGEVKDRDRSTLTRQTAHHIREEIVAFEHRLQIPAENH